MADDAARQTALITGASSGIGAEIARHVARAGFDVVIAARRRDRLELLAGELASDHGVKVHVVEIDLSRSNGARALVNAVGELNVEIDFLVNNAGFGVYGNMAEQPLERTLQMVELNVVTLTYLTHHYLKQMVERGRGRILQIASIGAFQPSPLYAVYSATKAYVLSFSEAIHHELRGSGVTVTTCCPGLTDTEFHAVADHQKPAWMSPASMSAGAVAAIAVRAALRGKRLVVPGFVNWLSMLFAKLFPKRVVISMAAATMAMKKK